MDMPALQEGHRRLALLEGTWEGEETMHPSPWDPKGGVAFGRNENTFAVNGFSLLTDYAQIRDGATTFTGHGIFSYDAEQDLYSLYWVDSIGSPPELFTGRFDGDVLTLGHGGHMHVRMTWDMTEPGRMDSKMEMSQDGVSWNTLFEAIYIKK